VNLFCSGLMMRRSSVPKAKRRPALNNGASTMRFIGTGHCVVCCYYLRCAWLFARTRRAMSQITGNQVLVGRGAWLNLLAMVGKNWRHRDGRRNKPCPRESIALEAFGPFALLVE